VVHSDTLEVSTEGFGQVIDVTSWVTESVRKSGIKHGIVCIANPGSTAGITTIEFEPGALADLTAAMERLAPTKGHYRHNDTWGDGNGFAHLRSALIGAAKAFPVRHGLVELGTWQQVVFLDFDNRPRRRKLVLTVVGE